MIRPQNRRVDANKEVVGDLTVGLLLHGQSRALFLKLGDEVGVLGQRIDDRLVCDHARARWHRSVLRRPDLPTRKGSDDEHSTGGDKNRSLGCVHYSPASFIDAGLP